MKALPALFLWCATAALADVPKQLDDLPPALAATLRAAHVEATRLADTLPAAQARADAWGNLAMLYHAQRLHHLAEQAYDRALAENASDARWRYLRAIVYSERGEIERAVEDFRRVAVAQPDDATVRYRLGMALFITGELKAAAAELDHAMTLLPASALTLAARADVAAALGETATALQLLQRAWRLEPEAGQLAYKLAMLHRQLGDREAAQDWLRRQPNNSFAPSIDDPLLLEVARMSRSARFYEIAADWALARGDEQQAAVALRDAVALAPQDAALALRLVALLANLGRNEEALAETRRVLAVDDASAKAWYLLAWLLRQSPQAADLAEADSAAARSLQLEDDATTRALAAALAMRAERFAAAAAHYQRLAQDHPEQAYYRYWLGVAQLGAGDCAGRQAVTQAIALRNDWGEAHLVLARADAVCGAADAAQRRAQGLLKARDDVDTRLTTALAAFGQGRAAEAKRLATAELPHPDAALLLDALAAGSAAALLPPFAKGSRWLRPAEVR